LETAPIRTLEELLSADTCSFRESPATIVSTEEAQLLVASGAKIKSNGVEGGSDRESWRLTQKYELSGHPFLWLEDWSKDELFPARSTP